jgi:hypothetical protein
VVFLEGGQMGKENLQASGEDESTKEFLLKWGKRIGLIAIGLLGLSLIL